MKTHNQKTKKGNGATNAAILLQVILLLFFICVISYFYHQSREDKEKASEDAEEEMIEQLNEQGCLFYARSGRNVFGEWVCPAENHELVIIDPGMNGLTPDSWLVGYSPHDAAKKYGYSIKNWNGEELIPEE